MQNFVAGAVIALVIAVYFIWRKHSSLKSKEELAGHLENLLNDKSIGLKEREKLTLVFAWDICSSYSFFYKVLIPIFFSNKNNQNKGSISKFSVEKREAVALVMFKALWVNAKLMPLTYLVLLLCVFVVGVLFAKMGRVSAITKRGIASFLKDPHYS